MKKKYNKYLVILLFLPSFISAFFEKTSLRFKVLYILLAIIVAIIIIYNRNKKVLIKD